MTLDLDGASFNSTTNLCQPKNFLVLQKAPVLRRRMRKKLDAPIPNWATSQQDIENVNLPVGFLRDFIDYVSLCTDAPKSFALGTGLGILAVACGRCKVIVKSPDPNLELQVPIRLWQALIGNSGQRKSKVMDLGVGLLQLTNNDFRLPDDGSVEAWHDTMVDQPISLMHQEELSGLFDAQQRSYSNSLQSWLLSLWSGVPKDRKTKGGGNKTIERPRLNILGAIPPEIFLKKTKTSDWKSGFLPRFLYWGGSREEWAPMSMNAPKQEVVLADQLKYIHFNSDGDIVIPNLVSGILSDWFFETIEAHSNEFSEDVYAGLLRLQETGYVIAAMIAMSRSMSIVSKTASKRLIVHKDDMTTTVSILNLCKKTVEALANKANKSIASLAESSLEELLNANPEGLTIKEVSSRLNMGYQEARRHLLELAAAEQVVITRRISPKAGRPSSVYKKVEYS
jgi:hypothetical protein